MTREEFHAKWAARRAEWEKLGALVSGAMMGYSRAQLLRQYKEGRLRGHKKGKHVFFRAGDLPRKPRGGRPLVATESAPTDKETLARARRLAERRGINPAARHQVP